jgi:Flp pilus assembly protein protease CpaA
VRVSLLVYGVLYVVLEMVGYQLEQVGWSDISALDVATAVTDALLTVAVCAAVLLALDLGLRRRRRSMTTRHQERADTYAEICDEPMGVTSWRPEPLAITAQRVEEQPKPAYRGNPYSFAGHRFPKDPGTLL